MAKTVKFFIKVADKQKQAAGSYVKIDNIWKKSKLMFIKKDGVWTQI